MFQQTFEKGLICVDIQLIVHGQADVCRCEIMSSYYRPLLMTLDLSSSMSSSIRVRHSSKWLTAVASNNRSYISFQDILQPSPNVRTRETSIGPWFFFTTHLMSVPCDVSLWVRVSCRYDKVSHMPIMDTIPHWSGVPYLCHAHSIVVRRINEKVDQYRSSLPL